MTEETDPRNDGGEPAAPDPGPAAALPGFGGGGPGAASDALTARLASGGGYGVGRRVRAAAFELLKTLVLVIVLVLTIRAFVVEAYVINGRSMEPTFHDSERLLISKFAPRFESLNRGDIVIFEHPDEPGKRLIKRVLGFPGEFVRIERGILFVNGQRVDEPYLESDAGGDFDTKEVPDGHFFVLGDNRGISNDSRRIGFIPQDRVLGKALLLFYPPSKVRFL